MRPAPLLSRLGPVAALAATLPLLACAGQPRIQQRLPHQRDYQPPTAEAQSASSTVGSLWREGHPASMLFTDARALRENDLVVIKIEELADARRSSDTDLTRNSKTDLQFSGLFSKLATAGTFQPSMGVSAGLTGQTDQNFRGQGSSARSERLIATVPSLVRKVLPNGNLFIEGQRVVLVNNEEQHFYISGVIRPIDIEQDNSIKSSMVADAEIEFTGRGDMSDNQRQGWFQRHLPSWWPF
jgi:flagellar L-ring protein precursor FlgH